MQDSYAKINNVCLMIITMIAMTVALSLTQSILVPFVFSLFLYAILSPAIKFIELQLKIPRLLAIVVTFLLEGGLLALLIVLVANSMNGFLAEAALYKTKVAAFLNWGSQLLLGWGIELELGEIQSTLKELPILSYAQQVSGGVFNFVGKSFLVGIFVMFLILGETRGSVSHPLLSEIQGKVSRYIVTKSCVSLATGLFALIVLGFMKIEMAFMFGVLTVLLNFIPSIGSIIATVIVLPVALLQYGFGWELWVSMGLLLSIQFLIGNVLEPKLMGESLDLHPVTVLLFLMFWGLVWGIAGMFLAVPITAILKIVLSRIPTTKNLAELLAGRIATN